MAERPKTINQASDDFRYIKMSINVNQLNKDWFVVGEKGVYANITLALQPNGKLDNYGNLGMVTQDVPKEIYAKEVKLPKEKKTKGPILGNGAEFARAGHESSPGSTDGLKSFGQMSDADKKKLNDDLPF